MDSQDLQFMQQAIEEAKKSQAEDGRIHPKVGVVVVREGRLLAAGYPGEQGPGDHAEFTVLEKKLASGIVAAATVYTTLEPCTTRRHPKVPCAQRIVERKIARVVIGMLDPNPDVSGKGQQLLAAANITTELFPRDLMSEVEDLNRDFIRAHRSGRRLTLDPEFLRANAGRPLDDWYKTINAVYWARNFYRDPSSIFAHLVEVIGGLSMLASQKQKPGVSPEDFVPKAVAWWMALCGKVRVASVGDMVWAKFPYACPYCERCPHDPDECAERKASRRGPDWDRLRCIAEEQKAKRPLGLREWQRMFSAIYPVQQTEEYGPTFARLTEELGELAEALRVFPASQGYFLNEAADVFAWLMHIQNLIDRKRGTARGARGALLEKGFCEAYPDLCADCGAPVCACRPILGATVGRIAQEVPRTDVARSFLSSEGALMLFDRGQRT